MVRVRYAGPVILPTGMDLKLARIGVGIPGGTPVQLSFGDECLVPRSMLDDLLSDPDSRFEVVAAHEPIPTRVTPAERPKARRAASPLKRKRTG